MQTIMKEMPEICSKFHNGDGFVIDRSSCNVKRYLSKCQIPSDKSQLSDALGNRSQLVIKVVEAIKGHLKICF